MNKFVFRACFLFEDETGKRKIEDAIYDEMDVVADKLSKKFGVDVKVIASEYEDIKENENIGICDCGTYVTDYDEDDCIYMLIPGYRTDDGGWICDFCKEEQED